MPRLILTNPEFANQSCVLPDGTFSVGRSRSNRIVIRDDSVSKEHCELLVWGSEIIVRERGSRNGTFVNGVRVEAQSGVHHGERLRFGRIEARVEIEFLEGDASTAISATQEYQRFLRKSGQPEASQPTFPVVFTPRASPTDHAAPATVTASPPPAQPALNAPSDIRTSGAEPLRMKLPWIWLATRLVVVAVIFYLMWRK
jgi:pSer/pThr/pTyr-binding forkhead associated (FHA) protein